MIAIESSEHASNWVTLYNQGQKDHLLHDLATTEFGTHILLTAPASKLPIPEKVEYKHTLIEEQYNVMMTYLEKELLSSNYVIIPASNPIANILLED